MHKSESILEKFWDFEIQLDHLIPPRRPDLVLIDKKKNLPPSGLQSRNKREQKGRQILGTCQRTKNVVEH